MIGLGLLGGFVAAVIFLNWQSSKATDLPDGGSSRHAESVASTLDGGAGGVIDAASVNVGNATSAASCPQGAILIPGGEFLMGSNEDYPPQHVAGLPTNRENLGWKPAHKVKLSPYCMDRYEITASLYRECVVSKGCTIPGTSNAPSELTYHGGEERQEHPVTHVTFEQARSFCRWKGGDLPSEAQWEFAARGTDERIYPWGNGPAGRLLTCKDVWPKSERGQAPERLASAFGEGSRCFPGVKPQAHGPWRVGMAKAGASPFGIEDMAGNVMEWVRDCYDTTYYQKLESQGVVVDPVNENERCPELVVRGGGWSHGGGNGDKLPAWNMRTYWREPMIRRETEESQNYDAEIGFRCVYGPTLVG